VRRWPRFVCCLLLACLAVPCLAQPLTAIFYQPQSRDRKVAAEQWPGIFATARAQGFDTLVVQWTRFGEAFAETTDAAGRDWLTARLREARSAQLKLVLGLAADEDGFSRLQQPAETLDGYLLQLSQRNRLLAQSWLETLGAEAIDGWYLPLEIDDRRWREDDARSRLAAYLSRDVRQLSRVSERPVYVSSFFAGNMAPARYAEMLAELGRRSGVRVWVQDGAGTGKLNAVERQLYLDAASPCPAPAVRGVIYELFRQTSADATFKAEALSGPQVEAVTRQRAACDGDSVFFSLRYLPALQGILPR
jgi:hypothetical protein